MKKNTSRLRVWLQLFRAPNLFTVPGDPLAGYLLALRGTFSGAALLAMAASGCFYAAGLLMNDLADLDEDRRDRPERPLPSGAASKRAVWIVMIVLIVCGLFLCALGDTKTLGLGALIVAAIALYNFALKTIPMIGALNMGLCRGGSLLLGAAFAGQFTLPSIIAVCLTTAFIAAVTHLARFEMEWHTPVTAKLWPLLVLAIGTFAFPIHEPHVNVLAFFGFYTLALAMCSFITKRVLREVQVPLPPFIGAFIRVLLLIQAAFCASSDTDWIGYGAALLLLALAPISRLVGSRFYAS